MRHFVLTGLVWVAGLACTKKAQLASATVTASFGGTTMAASLPSSPTIDVVTQLASFERSSLPSSYPPATMPVLSPTEHQRIALYEDEDPSAFFCYGKDLNTQATAANCMDSSSLLFSGNDCGGKCKCDSTGKVTCDIPSDCGPQKDVVKYCSKNPLFSCDCLGNTNPPEQNVLDADQMVGEVVEARDRKTEEQQSTTAALHPKSESEPPQSAGIPEVPPCFIWLTCTVDTAPWLTRTKTARQLETTFTTSIRESSAP